MPRAPRFRLPRSRRSLLLTVVAGTLVTASCLVVRVRSELGLEPALSSPVRTQIVDCAQPVEVERRRCARRALAAHLRGVRPLARALAQVNADARSDEWLSRRCHVLLHEVGARWTRTVRPGDVTHDGKDCAAGFVHGWMIEHLDEVDADDVDAWCDATRSPLARADCEHGMGHVLVRRADGDVPAALARCAELGLGSFVQHCGSGAFMENRLGGQGRTGASASRYWSAADPWRPCRRTTGALRATCSAWAVRDVAAHARVGWCTRRLGDRGGRTCRIATGAIAPVDRSARATCGGDRDCWFGRGFAWALLGWNAPGAEPAARRCADAASARVLARACARGVGMRRAASLEHDDATAARSACNEDVPRTLAAACRAGAAQRRDVISWV